MEKRINTQIRKKRFLVTLPKEQKTSKKKIYKKIRKHRPLPQTFYIVIKQKKRNYT